MPTTRPTLPSWWTPELYSFLRDMPIEGWVWEFMRRARLKEALGAGPVDAMNPNPDLNKIDPDCWNYYKSWNHPHWRRIKKPPFLIPPAVNISGQWPAKYQGQQYRIDDEAGRNLFAVHVDLNRRDTRIISDFQEALIMLRKDLPERKRTSARIEDWHQSHILETWDLHEYAYAVSWSEIVEELTLNSVQQARNSFNSAKNYIEKNKWKTLVRNFTS